MCDFMGGIHFLHTQKKKQNKAKYPFRAILRRPWCPFRAIHPCCTDKLQAPWGAPIFDSHSEGGYQNFPATPRGGVSVFYGHFSRKGPPPYEKFWTVPKWNHSVCLLEQIIVHLHAMTISFVHRIVACMNTKYMGFSRTVRQKHALKCTWTLNIGRHGTVMWKVNIPMEK